MVIEPASEDELATELQRLSRQGLAVVPRGGGTKMDWAPPPSHCDVLLSTRRLDALVEHEPGDLVCVVQAGMRLCDLQAALAPHGQRVMLDPAHGVDATVGGIVAGNAYGPLRTRYGGVRDLVIGARFVLSDGTVGHSGGKVVKNVAGYDVGKLLVGSLGTLAVVTQVALRLHPVPAVSRTVVTRDLDAWRDVEASAAVVLWPEKVLLLRLEGTGAGVEAQLAVLDGTECEWPHASEVWAEPAAPVAVMGVPRTQVLPLLDRLAGLAERAVAYPSLGVVEARLGRDSATAAAVQELRRWAEQVGGHLTVRRPTPELAAIAWPRGDDVAVDLMRSVKRALDPSDTLSPGRMGM